MEQQGQHCTTAQKIVATAIGVSAALVVAIIAASIAIDYGVRSDFVTGVAAQSMIPFIFVFWKWPGLVLKPIELLKHVIRGK